MTDRFSTTQFLNDNIWFSLSSTPETQVHSLPQSTVTTTQKKANTNRNSILMHQKFLHCSTATVSWSTEALVSQKSQRSSSTVGTCWVDCRSPSCNSKHNRFAAMTQWQEQCHAVWMNSDKTVPKLLCWWLFRKRWWWSKIFFSWFWVFTVVERIKDHLPSSVCLWQTSKSTVFLWVVRTDRTWTSSEQWMTVTKY